MVSHSSPDTSIAAIGTGQSLFVAVWLEGGAERVRYFTDEQAARAFLEDHAPDDAFGAIGAWGDLDWEDFERWVDQSEAERPPPSRPITDDDF